MSDTEHSIAELERVLYATEEVSLERLALFAARMKDQSGPPSAAFWGALANVVSGVLLELRRYS